MSQFTPSSRPEPIGSPDRLAVERLSRIAGAMIVLMPLAMWLANRSAPLVLGLAAATCLVGVVVSGNAREVVARLRAWLRDPIALAVAGFLFWALISLSWSHRPLASLEVWGELVLPLAFALVIAVSRLFVPRPMLLRFLALSMILASALIVIELASGMSQRAAFGIGKLQAFVFNRPAIVILLLAVPVGHALWSQATSRTLDRLLAATLTLAVAILVARSESAAARLGFAVAALCWILAMLAPRLTSAVVASAFVLTMALAPVLGQSAERWLPSMILDRFNVMTGQARIDIWQSFGEVARARPFVGAGFGTSATMHEHPVAAEVSPERRTLLAASHPHDMPLQAWAETGMVGAGLLTLAGLLLLARLRRLPSAEQAPRLALFAAAFSIATVGHGAWQGWWIAGLGIAVLLFHGVAASRQRDSHV